jgi:hypothetical protein
MKPVAAAGSFRTMHKFLRPRNVLLGAQGLYWVDFGGAGGWDC